MPRLPAGSRFDEGLTDKQAAFVAHVVRHGDPKAAVTAAGYSSEKSYWALLRLPHVQQAIVLETRRALATEGAPLAFARLFELLRSKDTAAKDVIAAARIVVDRAGYVPPSSADQDPGAEKPLESLTAEELHAKLEQVESQLAARATPVDSAPDKPGSDTQTTDKDMLS